MARNRTPMAVGGSKSGDTKFRTDSNDDVGYGDFYNAKNSKYSEGSSKDSGASSAEPGGRGLKSGDVSSENEPSRLKRNGIQNTNSGPKPKSTSGTDTGQGDAQFFQHTIKDN